MTPGELRAALRAHVAVAAGGLGAAKAEGYLRSICGLSAIDAESIRKWIRYGISAEVPDRHAGDLLISAAGITGEETGAAWRAALDAWPKCYAEAHKMPGEVEAPEALRRRAEIAARVETARGMVARRPTYPADVARVCGCSPYAAGRALAQLVREGVAVRVIVGDDVEYRAAVRDEFTDLRALTVRPWWADAIKQGAKRIENRQWAPPEWAIGRRIAIHAGVGTASQLRRDREGWPVLAESKHQAEHYASRAFVCTAVIDRVVDEEQRGEAEGAGVPSGWLAYADPGSRCWWILRDVIPLRVPVTWRAGLLGLWRVPDRQAELVRELSEVKQ